MILHHKKVPMTMLLVCALISCEKKDNVPPEAVVFQDVVEWDWPLVEWYGGNSFYWWHRTEESGVVNLGKMSPDSWKKPHDFENGSFHLRFEILEQPTDTAFVIQFGIWQDLNKEGGYSETVCSEQFVEGGAGAKIEKDLGAPATWWQKRPDVPVDFRRPQDFYRIGIVLWNDTPRCLPMAQGWNNSNACSDPETVASYFFPMKARVTVVAVAEGHSFSGWENYPQ